MIYFAQTPSGSIKIGTSMNVARRLRTLKGNFRESVALLGVIPGGRKEEYRVHQRFAHLRFPGTEQFRPDRELMEFIRRPLFASRCPESIEAVRERKPCYCDFGLTAKDLKPLRLLSRDPSNDHRKAVRWAIHIVTRYGL